MKHLLTLVLIGLTSLYAQNRSATNLRNSTFSDFTESQSEVANHYQGETVIWSEDFASGIPTTWMNYGTADPDGSGPLPPAADIDAKWEYRGTTTTPSNATGSRGAYAAGQLPIQSTTAANGFVVFDSDFLDNAGIAGNFCGTGAIACAPHVANLETGMINLVGHPTVDLRFTQYYRRFAGVGGVQTVPATYLDFSTDGGVTWTGNVTLNASVPLNSATARNSAIAVPIGQYVGNQDSVKIRFRFEGNYYFWIIDDIAITDQQANSIASYPYFTGEAFDVEFSGGVKQGHLSTSQAQSINFKGSLWNNGAAAQTGVKLSVSIFKDGNHQTDIIAIQQNLAAGDSAILTTQSWTPTAPGNYEWIYMISSDSIQPIVISDTISFDFESVQSMDFGSWDNSIGASTNTTQWGDGSAVCQLMRILANDTLLGVEIGISSLTQPGSIIEFAVYDSAAYLGNNGSWNNSLLRAFEQVVVSSTDTVNGFVYVDLTNPTSGSGVPLSSNTRAYFLNVTMYNNSGANYITLKNDQTYLKSPGTGYMYLAALGSWYSGYSGSKTFNNIWLRANLSGGQSAPPFCISDIPTITTETACGPESVTMNASWSNTTSQQHIWLSPTGVIRGRGATFTTPVITASTTQDSRLFAADTSVSAVSGGPQVTLTTPAGSHGNFSNGMWYTSTTPFSLDSAT
ncbi:MAG: hypothetical protein NWR89_05840, partial [Schleiferiaceae bacterium]|nr:hypothetical protein [Schleiferiaceae bacterium]